MGDTWLKLSKEETEKITIIDNRKTIQHEICLLCHNTNCDLVGRYGTYNEFGSFLGICLECLKILNKLSKSYNHR